MLVKQFFDSHLHGCCCARGGFRGMGSSKIKNIMNSQVKESLNKSLKELLVKSVNADCSVIEAYFESIMCESVHHRFNKHIYLENEPTQVHDHIEGFIHPNNKQWKIINYGTTHVSTLKKYFTPYAIKRHISIAALWTKMKAHAVLIIIKKRH